MAVDLLGKQGHIGFNNLGWAKILRLAKQYGWQPMGTKTPEEWEVGEWEKNPNYFTNDGQRVTSEDASNIAAALEVALDDIPDHEVMEDKIRFVRDEPVVDWRTAQNASPFEWFGGQGKQRLQDFIKFCEAGGFSIF